MDERTPVVDQLKSIRQSLSESIHVADHLLRKFRGPIPTDNRVAPDKAESIMSIVSDIKTQSEILQKLMSEQHALVGDIDEKMVGRTPGRQVLQERG